MAARTSYMKMTTDSTSKSSRDDDGRLVLVTGAAGYVGGRLVHELLARGHRVRCMVIDSADAYRGRWPGADIVTADARDESALAEACAGVDSAFYLIQSILPCDGEGVIDAVNEAVSFSRAAAAAGLRRIIYLGSLLDRRAPVDSCQAGRVHVAGELRQSGIPVTELRADIIIGSGSVSYEIIRNLLRRLPVMLLPRWTRRRHLPVWIDDVIGYLAGALENEATSGGSFELCGEELTFDEMLRQASAVTSSSTRFIRFPYANVSFYSYVASLLTPVPDELARAVLGGLSYEVDCRDRSIHELVPLEPLTFSQAMARSLASEQGGAVVTRWSDAWPHEFERGPSLGEFSNRIDYKVAYAIDSDKNASSLFASVCDIGGDKGWLHDNWMWRLRGGFDRLIKGVGLERGRKKHDRLEVNEVIDFWRVEAIEPDRRLLLRAEFRMPGRGWLELTVGDEPGRRRLAATVYFSSRGLAGHLYWYAFYPFHGLIFRRLLRAIEARAKV